MNYVSPGGFWRQCTDDMGVDSKNHCKLGERFGVWLERGWVPGGEGSFH